MSQIVCPRCPNKDFRLGDDGTVDEFSTQPLSVLICTICDMRMNIQLVSDEREP